MVDPVAALSRSIAALRLQLRGVGRDAVAPRAPRASDGGRSGARVGGAIAALPGRLAAIDRDDPARRSKLLRAFLEAALLDELGAGLQTDPAFHAMVDQVAAALGASEETRRLVDAAIDELDPPPR